MHWPALGTVIPYQAIPDLRVKYASKSKPPRVGRVSTRRSSQRSPGRRFRRLRTPAHGVISSPVAPHTATLVRFDFYGDESGNEAVATKKGSYEMQGDAMEMQIGDPNAVYGAQQVDTTS
ncbi:MAG: hypothetical protein OER77_00805 [Myxococcales bacterium]|nr:hypothetical protein [Myxococcales bacterium]